jgi:hypothetical protein
MVVHAVVPMLRASVAKLLRQNAPSCCRFKVIGRRRELEALVGR